MSWHWVAYTLADGYGAGHGVGAVDINMNAPSSYDEIQQLGQTITEELHRRRQIPAHLRASVQSWSRMGD